MKKAMKFVLTPVVWLSALLVVALNGYPRRTMLIIALVCGLIGFWIGSC